MLTENEEQQPVVQPLPPASSFGSLRREGWIWGRFGVRAGWGITAYAAVWLVASGIASIFALGATGQMSRVMDAQAQAHGEHAKVHLLFTSLFVVVSDGIPFLATLGTAWLFSRGERRPFSVYGIGRRRFADLFPGAFFGLLLMSGLVGALWAGHLLIFDSRALMLGPALLYGLKWLVAFAFVGCAEEYFFRGYVQYTLMRGVWGLAERISPSATRPVAFWIAATLLSGLFALLHGGNTGETHFGLVVVFLAGMTFAYALWRTGSLWWAIGFHTTWDWAQSFLYGVPDSGNVSVGRLFVTHPVGNPLLSGGSDGPEGSVFVVIALLLAVATLHFTSPGAQPVIEQMPAESLPGQEAHASIS